MKTMKRKAQKGGRARKTHRTEDAVEKQFDTLEGDEATSQAPPMGNGNPPASVNLDEQKEMEVSEEEEADEAEMELGERKDAITKAFQVYSKIDNAVFFRDWHEAGMPTGENRATVYFERFYIYLGTVVEVFPVGTSPDLIMARKSLAEALGHRYTWLMEEELRKGFGGPESKKKGIVLVTFEEIFGERMKPLKKKLPWPYPQVKPMGTITDGQELM